ncbi:osmoprotectant NAGGN system M42 family peptidase [Kaustia mangrovi]|uniref:Osmoprotectant NAGGN system M42 family peptidase n=1 Tax=Kaustia mangrovi TaxID=2593653 RepID=A0A7S8HAE7_9HYPH|nr:osmoprotectant NAGGN system M42 family peptidase [Kaustia mangrovi]QPC41502.1 osmoprotectant NAGGN system M42 family peptidase [Kaustia mangrovi]
MIRLPIDTDYLADRLARLLAIPSPSGYTDMIVRDCCQELRRFGLEYELTRRGAIRVRLKGEHEHPGRALISHLDTLGAQVKLLKDNGRLELVPIGNWSSRFAEGARCTVFSEAGFYRGTILPLKASGHTFNDEIDTQPVDWRHVEVRVDALARTASDLEHLGVAVGDTVAIDPAPEFMENGFVVSRHLDDKAGVAVMFAALKAMVEEKVTPPVDVLWLFSISEEVGIGGSSVLPHDVSSLVSIDNGTTAPGQNSEEFGVTICMADQTGPFDYHLTRKLARLCRDNDIRYQKDIFRYYRSDSAAALEAGADVRTALITFGVDGSHGYERIHMHALRSLAELATAYAMSEVEIPRDAEEMGTLKGFTTQPMTEADQKLTAESDPTD